MKIFLTAFATIWTLSMSVTGLAQRADIGINSYAALDWARNRPFCDAMKTARDFNHIGASGPSPVRVDANGWPLEDAEVIIFHNLPRGDGIYAFSCVGHTRIEAHGGTVESQMYDQRLDRTTARIRVGATDYFALQLTEVRGGVRDIKLMRPTRPGAATSYPATQTFTDDYLAFVRRFSLIRAMDLLASNSNPQRTWADRVAPSSASFARNGHQGEYGWQGSGVAWEYIVRLANEAERDLWINVPVRADDAYIRALARLLRDGTTVNGVVYEPLDPDRKLYVEFSNEVWNSAGDFSQGVWNVEAAEAEVKAGGSPLSFDGADDKYTWAWRRVGLGAVRISRIFREEFGDAAMMTRIRPVLAWQQQDGQATGSVALDFIDRYFGAASANLTTPHPVSYYIWGGGGSAYYGPDNERTDLTIETIWNSGSFNTTELRKILREDALLTVAYGIERVAYEGGPSMDGETSSAAKEAAWSDPRMTELMINHHNIWSQMNGGLLAYFADADQDYQWAFVHDVVPPHNDSAKMRAIDRLNAQARVRPRFGYALPVALRGGAFVRSQPSWLLTAFGRGQSIELLAKRDGERGPDWVMYAVRSDAARPVRYVIEIDVSQASEDARLQVRWHGEARLAAAVSSGTTLRIPVLVAPGVHGIVVRADAGWMHVNALRVRAE